MTKIILASSFGIVMLILTLGATIISVKRGRRHPLTYMAPFTTCILGATALILAAMNGRIDMAAFYACLIISAIVIVALLGGAYTYKISESPTVTTSTAVNFIAIIIGITSIIG